MISVRLPHPAPCSEYLNLLFLLCITNMYIFTEYIFYYKLIWWKSVFKFNFLKFVSIKFCVRVSFEEWISKGRLCKKDLFWKIMHHTFLRFVLKPKFLANTFMLWLSVEEEQKRSIENTNLSFKKFFKH